MKQEVSVFQGRSRKMTAIQKKKMYLVFAMMVMLAFSHLGACVSVVDEIQTACASKEYQAKCDILTGNCEESGCVFDAADTLLVCPADALPYGFVAGARRMAAQSERFYINSVFAVLFKIAVIPDKVFAVAMTADKGISCAGHRVVCYVHNSDGKKENPFLFF